MRYPDLTALLREDRGARAYYAALPPSVQQHLHGTEYGIGTAEELYRAAERMLHTRGATAFFSGEI